MELIQNKLSTTCCIVGGGPAGMMLGLLLARAGIEVVVLEKHADFFRDFRGDTIHPSTFELMHELGLLEEFLKVPHQELKSFCAVFNNTSLQIADFTHLPVKKPVLGLMPQWDFLKFLEKHASKYTEFKLMMNANVTDIIKEDGRITGVRAETKEGMLQITAGLVVGTDGRDSTIRAKAGLKVIKSGVPIDVLWFRIKRETTDPGQILGRFVYGKVMVMLNRNNYWQCAYVINKGRYEKIKQQGIEAFRNDVVSVAPFLSDRNEELKSWDDIKLLSVDIDHLEKWYTNGLLCIGDSAHAMSPIAGVGINLAIQDAVAAANILYEPMLERKIISTAILQLVQKRRAYPTMVIQKLQMTIQNFILKKRISNNKESKPPLVMRLFNMFSLLQRLPAKIIGIGVRPEHIQSPVK